MTTDPVRDVSSMAQLRLASTASEKRGRRGLNVDLTNAKAKIRQKATISIVCCFATVFSYT